MANTPLDNIVDYPAIALRAIGTNADVVKLLTNNPDVSMDSDEAYDVFDKFLFDYEYVDDTVTDAAAFICVESEVANAISPTMNGYRLYITISCHKRFMELDPAKFPSLTGNRKDNLVRYVDNLLNGNDLFGIGPLTLLSVKTVPSAPGFTSRELTYAVPDFARVTA